MTLRRTPRAEILAVIALVIVINLLGLPLRTDAAPIGIVSLQLATSVEVADSVLESWAGVSMGRILLVHGLDVVLPVVYALAIRSTAARLRADRARVAGLVAALADQVENVLMAISILVGPTTWLVQGTLVAAVGKWGALACAIAVLVRASITIRRQAVVA